MVAQPDRYTRAAMGRAKRLRRGSPAPHPPAPSRTSPSPMIDDSPPGARPARLWLPDPPQAAHLAATAALVWLAVRLATTFVMLLLAARLGLTVEQVLAPHPSAALTVVLVTAVAVVLEERRRRERVFYANLGVPPVWTGLVGAAVAGVLELAVRLVVGAGG